MHDAAALGRFAFSGLRPLGLMHLLPSQVAALSPPPMGSTVTSLLPLGATRCLVSASSTYIPPFLAGAFPFYPSS
jgi:hypothetical protein